MLGADPDFIQGIPGDASAQRSGFKPQHLLPGVQLSPSGGERPQLAFEVGDNGGLRPGQQRGDYEANALARPGRGERQDVLLAVVTQVRLPSLAVDPGTDVHAFVGEQPGFGDVLAFRPASRPVQVRQSLARMPRGRLQKRDRKDAGPDHQHSRSPCRRRLPLDGGSPLPLPEDDLPREINVLPVRPEGRREMDPPGEHLGSGNQCRQDRNGG